MAILNSVVDSQAAGAVPARQSAPVAVASKPSPSSDAEPKGWASQAAQPSQEKFLSSAQTIQGTVQKTSLDVVYGIDKGSGHMFFKFVDPKTQQTIRQVPPDEVLAMAKRIRMETNTSASKGLLVDAVG